MGGLIWITGHPSAGKTTIASLVTKHLRDQNVQVVMLDGDELRSILGDKIGFASQDRKSLAFIYSRLCKKLADSGITVIIATVAMFDSVREENKLSNERYFEVFLNVPIEIRSSRDPKGLYLSTKCQANGNLEVEEPRAPDLIIDNYGDVQPDNAAKQIVSSYLGKMEKLSSNKSQNSNKSHWDLFYQKRKAPINPSSFAIFCNENYFYPNSNILEVGCGNGRDAFYFCKSNSVIGIDVSAEAILINKIKTEREGFKNINFICGEIDSLSKTDVGKIDFIYSRFTIHAMNETSENKFIKTSLQLLDKEGMLLLEFRTINDEMMKEGIVLSKFERMTDHYRRYIEYPKFLNKLSSEGFEILFSIEKQGLAQFGSDNPVVARVVAIKK
jgi:adenylylsulfate kinase-like enzyme/ubiquinone/menaquinone biosynthesis C-methylase UbiE